MKIVYLIPVGEYFRCAFSKNYLGMFGLAVTINVPVVYMVRYVLVLRGLNP